MSVNKRRTRSGFVYDVRLRTPEGAHLKRTFATRREASAFEASQRADIARGGWIDPRRQTIAFADWAAEWLASDPAKRPKTRATDESTIRLHLAPLAARPLGAVSALDVQRLVASWTGSPASIRRRYAVLRAIFASAVAADRLVRSPCRGVRLPQLQPRERRLPSSEEVGRLAIEVPARWRAMVWVGVVCGLRFSEVAALRVRSLDLLRGRIIITEGLTEARGIVVFAAPKSSAARRSFALPDQLVSILAAHLAAQGLNGADPEALVFTAVEGGPVRYSTFRTRVWAPACIRAGLQGLGFHDLRRLAATTMVATGVDVRTAQARLGHSDPRLTLGVYAQATEPADRRAADTLAAHFFGDSAEGSASAAI